MEFCFILQRVTVTHERDREWKIVYEFPRNIDGKSIRPYDKSERRKFSFNSIFLYHSFSTLSKPSSVVMRVA